MKNTVSALVYAPLLLLIPGQFMLAEPSFANARKGTSLPPGKSLFTEKPDSTLMQNPASLKLKTPPFKPGVYSLSGIGAALTYGSTNDILRPRTSTSLGLNISLGKSGLFLYPSADLLVFNYHQDTDDPDYLFSTQKGRSTFTSFSLMMAAPLKQGKFRMYAFAGPGWSLIKEPRSRMEESTNTVWSEKSKSKSWLLKSGLGMDYTMGAFILFAEGSYSRYFRSLQERKIELFPVYGGLKTNITAVFKQVKKN